MSLLKKTFMKQAALLVRVSTDVQEYTRQVRELKEKASREGYEVKDENVYAEKISGFTALEQREELTRLMQDIRENRKNISMIY